MSGELLAFRRAGVGAPVADYSRLVDRARVNKGGRAVGVTLTGDTGTSLLGTTITGGASHTKSAAWGDLVASTAHATELLEIIIEGPAASGVTTGTLFDIATGSAGNESIIIPNLMASGLSDLLVPTWRYTFPIGIPAGTRLSCKLQGAVSAETLSIAVQYHAHGPASPPGTACVAYGPDTGTSTGLVPTTAAGVNTESAWLALGVTSAYHRWIVPVIGLSSTNSTATKGLFDIGVDRSGGTSYSALITDLPFQITSTEDIRVMGFPYYTVDLEAGARLAIRYQADNVTGTHKPVCAVYGVT